MSIHELKRTIHNGNQAAHQAKRTLEQAASAAGSITELAQLTIHDSQDCDAEKALKLLLGIDEEIDHAVRRIDAAVAHANAYLTSLG
ncbi:hypothetical protein O7626_07020 [Micromonospora sp. WMMD1102]|uniref:hypothetical protein n=1 Tax=Micromonospora sp. WMMD1102 TaxID=3016105 RepID=UPI0024157333|nr:hypothetical protein [Micromonospora sp. WMMD1102]MDG4785684.1 hypothetical protein [Micromonospora sp. WMMD1102]